MATVEMMEFIRSEIDQMTIEGTLYRKLDDKGTLECFSCGHRCIIKEGRRGICKVRFNEGGVLRVPYGYVGALQCDPTEKKPFFHIYPGSDTLTFGMLGCDFHCSYCFSGTTRVPTTRGMETLESLCNGASRIQVNHDGTIAYVDNLSVFSHTGQARRVKALFRHPYSGEMLKIIAAFCPSIECTPDHRFLAIPRPMHGAPPQEPRFVEAKTLSRAWCLAIPKRFEGHDVILDVPEWIAMLATPDRMKRQWSEEFLRNVFDLNEQGYEPEAIVAQTGGSSHRVSTILAKVRSGQSNAEELLRYKGLIMVEGDFVRLFNEHAPGIPKHITIDARLAELFGYYCAEGCVWQDTERRAHSAMLTFSFGLHEEHLAKRVALLLTDIFGVKPTIKFRETTCAVVVYKSSLGLLFEALCGADAHTKRVPPPMFDAHAQLAQAFLRAYAMGDGSQEKHGGIITPTVSQDLAYGVAWLVLKSGAVPSVRAYKRPERGDIDGREIRRSGKIYHVRWHPDNAKRRCWQDDEFYYIPIRKIDRHSFDGYVYNMEVEKEHTYLPNFVVAANCQNWLTSQVLRDPHAEGGPTIVTPEQLVASAKRFGAPLIGSSYNEPLITSEWAVEVFKVAKREGLKCVYISNGNLTPEVLAYLRPHLVGYKIDLKSMRDKNYRKLGGVLQNTVNGIKIVHEAGLWLEIVTLIVPGFNDSDEELTDAANYIASISKDIPWHVTAFHKDYKMTDPDNTDAKILLRAAEIGKKAGLKFVYAGNLPGQVGPFENTWCPRCNALLIERFGYVILDYRLSDDGHCPDCGEAIPGIWPKRKEVRLGRLNDFFRRMPRPVMRFRSDLYQN